MLSMNIGSIVGFIIVIIVIGVLVLFISENVQQKKEKERERLEILRQTKVETPLYPRTSPVRTAPFNSGEAYASTRPRRPAPQGSKTGSPGYGVRPARTSTDTTDPIYASTYTPDYSAPSHHGHHDHDSSPTHHSHHDHGSGSSNGDSGGSSGGYDSGGSSDSGGGDSGGGGGGGD